MSFKAETVIVKYLIGEASADELNFLPSWLEHGKNKEIFDSYVKIHFELVTAMKKPDPEIIKKNLLIKMKRDKNPFSRKKLAYMTLYAAMFAIVFGLGFLFKDFVIPEKIIVEEGNLVPKVEEVVIQMENGQIKKLNPEGAEETRDIQGNLISTHEKSTLTFHSNELKRELVHNTLVVPKGKRFDLVLSDGSHIYLNSGSSLKFPVQFLEKGPREVYLTGEAFFDVAKQGKSNPFIVHVDNINVKVLGTKFVVNDYSENTDINTILVEGSVELYDGSANESGTRLMPGFKASWNKMGKGVATESVDTRIFTAWMDGKLIFRNATFKTIRHSLERKYNVSIENHNELLDTQRFDATFDIETINEIPSDV